MKNYIKIIYFHLVRYRKNNDYNSKDYNFLIKFSAYDFSDKVVFYNQYKRKYDDYER